MITAGALLAGCATAVGDGAVPSAVPTGTQSSAPTDPEAAARADSWLEDAVLPPGAVRSATEPQTVVPFQESYYAWPCAPMELRTGYWTIEDADVVETANWMKAHPTADLIDPVGMPYPDDSIASTVTFGNVPERDALEGIAYTVTRTESGVAVRAEIGVFISRTVCPTPEPGTAFGGPGQG